jgi:hypothetical protein
MGNMELVYFFTVGETINTCIKYRDLAWFYSVRNRNLSKSFCHMWMVILAFCVFNHMVEFVSKEAHLKCYLIWLFAVVGLVQLAHWEKTIRWFLMNIYFLFRLW